MNVVEVLNDLGIQFRRAGEHHHVSGHGWLGTDCPLCSPGTGKFKLGIREDTGHCSCWTCGSIDLLTALKTITGRQTGELVKVLSGLDRFKVKAEAKPKGKLTFPEGLRPDSGLLASHVNYLRARGFDALHLHDFWGVRSIGLAAKLSWRLFIPVDLEGRIVSWTTRSVSSSGVRYVSAPAECEAVPVKHLLYGEDHVRHGVVVCEGPADVWRIGPGAVATMGVSWTREQLLRLSRYPVRAVVFDSEPLAQGRAAQLCQALEPFPGRTVRVELDAADPGSASTKEVRKLRREFLE